ncbi:tetratricopeptide repeat protein [Pontibacter sp. KCTC 32443]|uniref:type IX secretion system periplasmic lipoprotein PorW/SprE n=1 Tax=Pontibacter TaxID=323449 RepID=UPI00164DDD76|nr:MULTISPECIES: tetratricopeptide repeat protein [Pontibacter]MBC5775814.1 tetratricopeptide repeat protein [Pontibacter sp. KCTC 32443]
MKHNPTYLLILLVALLLGACSVERNNPLSKTYHNTTARYNGYFLAREKLRAIEEALQAQMQYDYNQFIPIYPTIDSTTAKAAAADLEDVVKKASFPIQYHKNSKWIDDSYILIGRARYYQLDFPDAARTFKYTNTISKDKDARHEALVWLMRTYLQMGELDNANQVSELLRRERLNKDNARELYLARAQYHRFQGDTAAVIENLALSIPNFEEKDAQSRVRFALAQLYQATNQDKEAYKQYSKILRRNPPYDLGFFSRLYIGQVSELSDEQDQERIAGFYEKMLKDEKNTEYKDKILYEMAQFELRKQNFDKALSFLQQSLKERGSLPNQKAYSYLLAGKIYFDHLGKYDMAQAYYDSAVQAYPKTAPEYEAVAERRDVLTSFATQYNTIQTQDSLQRIARMSEADRMAFLQQLVQQQEEEAQKLAFAQQQAQLKSQNERRRSSINPDDAVAFNPTTNSAGVWYFDNPAAMASARTEFIRRWGDRPLQDFWRTRSRGENNGDQQQLAQQPIILTVPDTTLSAEARAEAQIQTYLQEIPLTTVAMQRSEKMVEEALFTLGNIYNQNLKNAEKATETYEQLLQRFPNTEHAAETYYALYLIYGKANNDAQKQVYYNKIKQQFPNSSFAQLVDDADFMSKNAAENLKAHALYDLAYTYYQDGNYKLAQQVVNQLVSQYPHSDIQDKTAFLELMITARTKEPGVLKAQLEQFRKDYPTSSLQANAGKLLETYTSLEQKNLLRKEAPSETAPKPKEATSSLTPEEKVSTVIASTAPAQPSIKTQLDTTQPAVADTTVKKPAVTAPDTVDLPDSAAVAASLPAPDPMAFSAEPDTAYYFVLIYPSGHEAFKDITAKYEKFNKSQFGSIKLAITEEPIATGKTMLVVRSINDLKIAKSYNIKQKGPQAPVGRIRGVEFTTFVISSANYQKFMQKKDVETYQTFFKNNY